MTLISINDVREAAERIRPVARRTPVLPGPTGIGRDLLLKPENLQTTGSFKIRGACNAVESMSPHQRKLGVITYSSGNHAQALAYAARTHGVKCTVVMPDDAKPVKVAATKALGADVVTVPPADRKAHAERLASENGYALVPPYDHPLVIAGQGTVGLEIVEDVPDVDVVLVPVGGGALAAGVASAVKSLRPTARVIGVEPELAADAAEGLSSGRRAEWSMTQTGRTVADGLRTNLSELTFAHLQAHLDGIVTVAEHELLDAVRTLATGAHLVVEPSGAATVAAFLHHADQLPTGRTVAVLSGGNVDTSLLADVLAG
ncbi:threonine/serine dehydratase [Saccharothrix sp. 6-C]|uniref:threonine ammonia-lyase n=1 Tax=Saccharothrix sp. 6-C TaxID=2781735 RepID=UPI0019174DFE|nr:threonine/serine dehydratase [Saccharothrix sp. 6-C]QQQ75758.1 threonine/serine dehydratase [Saccharothrix sp. 6-C]